VDLREALEQIGQDVMEGTSPRRALAELLRRGNKNMKGADRLAAEVNRRRRELLSRNNLDGTLQEIKKLLDEAVLAERKELARALDDDARFAEMQIESLPPSPAKAVQELSEYQWRSGEAKQKYEQIKDLLGREMLDQRFAGMKQALENASDSDRQAVNEMLDDLNNPLGVPSASTRTPYRLRHGVWHLVCVRLSQSHAAYSIDGHDIDKCYLEPNVSMPSRGRIGMVTYDTSYTWRNLAQSDLKKHLQNC
jgi:uncharacterized protein with von Willebrand factor type A (vWA) domain